MTISGTIQNGAILTEGSLPFPNGTTVTITESHPRAEGMHFRKARIKRARIPLVSSRQPGTVSHTSEQIDALLHDESMPS